MTPPNIIPTEAAHIADYVRREFDCEVTADPVRVEDEWPPVWRVEIKPDPSKWMMPPPAFLYAVSQPGLNAYRNDAQRPKPWLPVEEQDLGDVVDYIRSFHVGLMWRILHGGPPPEGEAESA